MANRNTNTSTVESPVTDPVEPALRPSRGPSVNRVTLIGRLTRDAEVRFTGTGTRVANLSLATNEGRNPEYHDLVVFDQLAERLGDYLLRGKLIYVEGRLRRREWEAQDGSKRRTAEVHVNAVQLLDRRSD